MLSMVKFQNYGIGVDTVPWSNPDTNWDANWDNKFHLSFGLHLGLHLGLKSRSVTSPHDPYIKQRQLLFAFSLNNTSVVRNLDLLTHLKSCCCHNIPCLVLQNGMSICNGKMSQFPQHLPNTTNMFLTRHLFQWAIKLTRFCEHQEKENRCLFSEQAHRTHSIFLNTNHAQHTSNQAANVFSQPPIHTAGKLASKTRALISV